MPQTRRGTRYGPAVKGGVGLTLTVGPGAGAPAADERFPKDGAVRAWFHALHVLGLLAHLTGWILVLVEAELDAEVTLWRVQPEYATDFIRPAVIQNRAVPDVGMRPAWIAFTWFLCSFLFHALYLLSWACDRVEWYYEGLVVNIGWWRWCEFTASASIMLLGASALLGTRETRVVIASTVSMGTTMFFGYLAEKNARRHINYGASGGARWYDSLAAPNGAVFDRFLPHLLGYVPFALSWWLALDSYYLATDAYTTSGAIVPDAGEALWAGFGLFMLFGAVQFVLLALDRGPQWYWIGEMAYVVLSVAAKFTMALLLLYRGLTPERVAQAASVRVVGAGA